MIFWCVRIKCMRYHTTVFRAFTFHSNYCFRPDYLQRAWELLKMCVASFPPPSDFEEYLEFALREYSPDRRQFVALLHNTLFMFGDQDTDGYGVAGSAHEVPAPTIEQLIILLEVRVFLPKQDLSLHCLHCCYLFLLFFGRSRDAFGTCAFAPRPTHPNREDLGCEKVGAPQRTE